MENIHRIRNIEVSEKRPQPFNANHLYSSSWAQFDLRLFSQPRTVSSDLSLHSNLRRFDKVLPTNPVLNNQSHWNISRGAINTVMTTCLTGDLPNDLPSPMKKQFELLADSDIGAGAFARIRKIRRKAFKNEEESDDYPKIFALKQIAKEPLAVRGMATQTRLETEVQWKASQHPNVVFLADFYEDVTHIHLVMEFCDKGSLANLPLPVSNELAIATLAQIASVFNYLHNNLKAVHRDCK